MAFNEEIARLTGTLRFNVEDAGLTAFETKLAGVEAKLRAFSEVTKGKFNVKVNLDTNALKEHLEKAANTKIRFSNVSLSTTAMNNLTASVSEKLGNARITLKNVKISMSDTLEQRAILRKQLESVSVLVKVVMKFKEADAALRKWKADTERRFKLHINADISQAKLYANAARTLRAVGARLGTFVVKSPKITLTVDRAALRAEIASVLAQIRREVKIKIDLNSTVSGSPRGSTGGGGHRGGRGHSSWNTLGTLGMAAVPGLAALMSFHHLNETAQKISGFDTALLSVTGNQKDADATKKRYEAMGKEVGFDTLKSAPVFVKMLAAGEGTGFTQPQSEKVFKNMAEYGRVMGLTGQNMHLALMAVERMMSKGQVYSRELKGELALQFPGAEAMMAQAMHMSIPKLLEAMKKGKVSALDALPNFAELLHQKAMAGGALATAEQQTQAQQERLHNAETLSVENFGKGGFNHATNQLFKEAAESLERMQPIVTALGAAFDTMAVPLEAIMRLFGKLGETWPDIAASIGLTSDQLAILTSVALLALAPFGMFLMVVAGIGLALEDLVAFSEGRGSMFGDWLKEVPEANKQFETLKQTMSEFSAEFKKITDQSAEVEVHIQGLSFSDFLLSSMRELNTLLQSALELMKAIDSFNNSDSKAGYGHIKNALPDGAPHSPYQTLSGNNKDFNDAMDFHMSDLTSKQFWLGDAGSKPVVHHNPNHPHAGTLPGVNTPMAPNVTQNNSFTINGLNASAIKDEVFIILQDVYHQTHVGVGSETQ